MRSRPLRGGRRASAPSREQQGSRGCGARLNREPARAALEERWHVLVGVIGSSADRSLGETIEEGTHADARHDTGERRSGTDVWAEAKREVLIGVRTIDAEVV